MTARTPVVICFLLVTILMAAAAATAAEKPPAAPADEKPPAQGQSTPASAGIQPPANAPQSPAQKPARVFAATLRLDAIKVPGPNPFFGSTGLAFPEVKAGVYSDPFAARLIVGYNRISTAQTITTGPGPDYDVTRLLLTVGAEVDYYFTPIAPSTPGIYVLVRGAKVFFFEDNSGIPGMADENFSAPVYFGAGFGAEWCFARFFSKGLETGVWFGFGTIEQGSTSYSKSAIDFPYGILTASAYFF